MPITIKPHHYLDMMKLYGSGLNEFVPDTQHGHAFYRVGNEILKHPEVQLQFTLGCDDVCAPCKHKSDSGLCTDAVTHLQGYTEKDAYNKMIDTRLAELLPLDFTKTYTSKEYCALLYARKEVIFEVWTLEPREQTQRRYELFCKGCARYLGLTHPPAETRAPAR